MRELFSAIKQKDSKYKMSSRKGKSKLIEPLTEAMASLSLATSVTAPTTEAAKHKRRTIPKPIRLKVWRAHIGDVVEGVCVCCKTESITIANYECGHVISVARGGNNAVANLRPICSSCNRSMGAQNMDDYIALLEEAMAPPREYPDDGAGTSGRRDDDCDDESDGIEEACEMVRKLDINAREMKEKSVSIKVDDDIADDVVTEVPAKVDDEIADVPADEEPAIPEKRSHYFDPALSFIYDFAYDDETVAQILGCADTYSSRAIEYQIKYRDLFDLYAEWCRERSQTCSVALSRSFFDDVVKAGFVECVRDHDRECEELDLMVVKFSRGSIIARCKKFAASVRGSIDNYFDFMRFSPPRAFIEDIAHEKISENQKRHLAKVCENVTVTVDDDNLFGIFFAWCRANGLATQRDLARMREPFFESIERFVLRKNGSEYSLSRTFSREIIEHDKEQLR